MQKIKEIKNCFWIELKVKGKQEIYLPMQLENFKICVDGSISDWLDVQFCMKGHKILAIGIVSDHITVEVE